MLIALLILSALQDSPKFEDPAPPKRRVLEEAPSPEARATSELTSRAAPRALDEDAVVHDWPTFLGPSRDGHCLEGKLDLEFGAQGPPLVWEYERGEGYASSVIAEGCLVFTHRIEDEVHVDCLEPETGKRFWRTSYPCDYKGRYIEDSGPRATPTISRGQVFVHGVDGELLCLELATGRILWRRNTTDEFKVGDDFFGVVSSPLVLGDRVIQNIGAPNGPSVAAFDRSTGALVWGAGPSGARAALHRSPASSPAGRAFS